ncbi:UNVERIFIED_CONTAM: hypothetical protein PYX00_003841 [Menopon gallinae]|uniref:Arrestin C-terminal-like domain-containing protein n=1 Tax=Menopon gallinae TaxID=328185 RepID=A0AAW2I3K3_9NEOP
MKRLGPNAHPFTMTVTNLAPPSVQLVPAKEYNGAPIGTSYDIRAYIADRPEEKLQRRSTVRMAIRVVQRAAGKIAPKEPVADQTITPISTIVEQAPPRALVDKPFLLSDGKVELEASLNKAVYNHGESVSVTVQVRNNSGKTVRRIKVFVVQFVDVCMFSNGKFKNIVAMVNSKEECPLAPWTSLTKSYTLQPAKGATKNWIALEDSFTKTGAVLASTVTCPSKNPEDRNVFAIYVSYYVKVKIVISPMGGELSVKLPFTLIHAANDPDASATLPSQQPEAKLATESESSEKKEEEKTNKTTMDVKVECHEPKPIKKINNILPRKCKPKNAVIQDENEIIKCEEEENI